MKLLFERSRAGRGSDLLPACDVPVVTYDQGLLRAEAPRLPEMAEVDLSRHYTELAKQTHGVNDGFYPLGSCTMKYNPRVNEEAAAQPGFTQLHPSSLWRRCRGPWRSSTPQRRCSARSRAWTA